MGGECVTITVYEKNTKDFFLCILGKKEKYRREMERE